MVIMDLISHELIEYYCTVCLWEILGICVHESTNYKTFNVFFRKMKAMFIVQVYGHITLRMIFVPRSKYGLYTMQIVTEW